tara:strand:- start:112 stop:591 length:480 start_codon:yes stop_codon:yes gene_type:complete
MSKKNNIFLILILLVISLSLLGAFFIEYVLNHNPCKLCIYERIPYILSILLIIEFLFFKKNGKITLLILAITFSISTVLAFYHFGIEQEFFSELSMCNIKNTSEALSKEELLNQLKQNNVSCRDVTFKLFGLSLASINTIFSFILSVIFLKLFLNYEKN